MQENENVNDLRKQGWLIYLFNAVGARSTPGLPRGMRRAGDYPVSYLQYACRDTVRVSQSIPQIRSSGSFPPWSISSIPSQSGLK